MTRAKEDNEKLWDQKYDKYIKDGLSREDARVQTEEKTNAREQQQHHQQEFMFQHPFTANVSGPTSSGKTYFVKSLLQLCMSKISPPPERILWLYKRWQPLYDIIKASASPPVEFIQGIPLDLEQDSFVHPGLSFTLGREIL